MAEKRPVRMCDVCGGVDDHPRHVFAFAPGDETGPGAGLTHPDVAKSALKAAAAADVDAVLEHVRDDSTTMRHMDCCREVGCPDGTCYRVTAGAESKRGAALVKHLTAREPDPQPDSAPAPAPQEA